MDVIVIMMTGQKNRTLLISSAEEGANCHSIINCLRASLSSQRAATAATIHKVKKKQAMRQSGGALINNPYCRVYNSKRKVFPETDKKQSANARLKNSRQTNALD